MNESTINQILRFHAQKQPHKIAYRFLQDGEFDESTITYAELDLKASQIASNLHKYKKDSPCLALLLFPSGLEFISAFFGCLYAGIIAVPAPIPRRTRTFDRMGGILEDTKASLILTDKATYQDLIKNPLFSNLKGITWILIDSLDSTPNNFLALDNDQKIAFLQYTSGSTSAPKGVMVSHKNILSNQQMIKEAFGHDSSTIFLGWLPLFHDMGLVGNILQPMYLGIPSILFSPVAFLQKPLRWLQAITRYGATTSGAPNFAYDLCVEKIGEIEKDSLDLSSWKVAFNGSEPVHYKTLCKFSEAFSRCGFKMEAFYPCYGMAETTVFITGNPCGSSIDCLHVNKKVLETNHKAITTKESGLMTTLVGTGKSWGDQKISIVNPQTKMLCPAEEVGEVWVRGSHVASGYWNQPEITQETFHATLDGENITFLRTGDLGFLSKEGNLFITGRLKDLMIFRGRNIYPQDVELIVEECDDSLRPHGCAAFSFLKEENEYLAIIAEVKRDKIPSLDPHLLYAKIRQAISQEFQISPAVIVLIKPSSLPKTSSGKVQRSLCKKLFLEDNLDCISQENFSNFKELSDDPIISKLSSKVSEIIQKPLVSLDPNISLASYGLDSLGAISLQVFVKETWGVLINIEELLDDFSISLLSQKILESVALEKSKPELFPSSQEYSLSYQQLGIWTHLQLDKESRNYNLAKALSITSTIDADKLKKSIGVLMERHTLLRTLFSDKKPLQTAIKEYSIPFCEENVEEKDLIAFLEKKASKIFSIENELLFTVWLLTTDTNRKILFIVAHHLITDLWSLGIFLEELFQVYNSQFSDKNVTFPQNCEYSNYVNWQSSSLINKPENVLDFWREKLAEDAPPIRTDYPRKLIPSYSAKHLTFDLSEELSRKIKEFSRECNATPFVVLLGCYSLLISQYQNENKLCIGTTASDRNDPSWYSHFGLFANPIPIAFSLSTQSFTNFIGDLKKIVLRSFGQFQLPFYYLLENLHHKRNPGCSPLFQTMFVMQQTPSLSKDFHELIIPTLKKMVSIKRDHLTIQPLLWQAPLTPYDLTLFMVEKEGIFSGSFEYKIDLFHENTIKKLLSNFLSILETYLSNPSRLIDQASPFLPLKKNQEIEGRSKKTIVSLFSEIVKQSRDACALSNEGGSITFEALDSYSNRLARRLIQKGVTPGSVVAVKLPHSPEVVISILAILKVGAIFLPINPLTPKKRIETIIADSGCSLILTNDLECSSVQIVNTSDIEKESPHGLPFLEDSDSIAYLMYTSGSTGKPKGVVISHEALLNYLYAIETHYEMKGTLHFPLYSSLGFDLTLTSLFFPLIFGHTIHLYPEEESIDSVLKKIFSNPQITHVKLTPSHLKLLDDIDISSNSIQQLIIGGEQLSVASAEKIYSRFSRPISIVNEYGPTEATIGCIFFFYPSIDISTSILPIGSPIFNTYAYILNPTLDFLPLQENGELYLGGINLAYGYWNNPSLTAEKFLPNPFLEGERIYKSGDVAKLIEPDCFICLGRADRQVKIRGFRIELDEIESCIQSYPHVKECLSIVSPIADELVLVAYFTVSHQNKVDLAELRLHLERNLPFYMVPSIIIPCDSMPLTTNGKIDVTSLPNPRDWLSKDKSTKTYQNDIQRKLVTLWAQILGLNPDQIGINHSFFELGGDSIKAIQLVSKGKTEGVPFSVSDLFQYPTIEQLSYVIENKKEEQISVDIVNAENNFLSPIQDWFFTNFTSCLNHYNQTVCLHNNQGFDHEIISHSFKAIVENHDALKMIFPSQKSYTFCPVTESFYVSTFNYNDKDDWRRSMDNEVAEAQKNLDIASGPLIRLLVFNTPIGGYIFIIMHHLIIDGVSWRIILEEFDLAIQQSLSSKRIFLPKKTDSYSTWISKTKKTIYPKGLSFRISSQKMLSLNFTEEESKLLLKDIHSAYQTQISDILLSTLYLSLIKIQTDSKIEIHLEGHGRNPEIGQTLNLSRTVGWFTSLNKIALHVSDPANLSILIKSIKEDSKKFLDQTPHPTIAFNYLGEFFTTEYKSFTFNPFLEGLISQDGTTPYSLQLIFYVLDKKLYAHFSFDNQIFPLKIPEQFISDYKNNLFQLITHCLQKEKTEFTPSDFGDKFISWDEWDTLLQQTENASIEKIYPLTPLQEGILYHSLTKDTSSAYIEQAVLTIDGEISPLLIKESFQHLVDSYETLRTSFFYEGLSNPKQVVIKDKILTFYFEEILKGNSFDDILEEFLEQDRKKGFDLSNDLMRITLLKLSDNKYFLIWSFHHLILDGWSLSILFNAFLKTLSALYQRLSPPFHFTMSPAHYLEWLSVQNHEIASTYWKKLLKDCQNPTTLPKKNHYTFQNSRSNKRMSFDFSAEQLHRLKQISQEYNLTLNSIFQTIWTFLLSHYTQNYDVITGTIVSGRNPNIEHIDSMVGLLIQTIPLKIKIDENQRFIDLTFSIQNQLLESEQYSFLSLSEIQSFSSLKNQLIGHLFVFENYPFAGQAETLIESYKLPFKASNAKLFEETNYDFLISLLPLTQGIRLEIQFNEQIYDASFINSVIEHFQNVIKNICIDPCITLNKLPFISSKEQTRLMQLSSPTANSIDEVNSLAQLFEIQVLKSPDSIAISQGEIQITYRVLDDLANQLAIHLISLGMGPEKGAIIYLDRSTAMIISWLAILKTGGFYVPIDPSNTQERISTICQEINPAVILTNSPFLSKLPAWLHEIAIEIDKVNLEHRNWLSLNVHDPQQLAYVLYTSGSTGVPKGIAMTHRAIINHFNWCEEHFNLNPSDRMLQLTTFSFDVSVCELYALFVGATLVLADKNANKDETILIDEIENEQITFLQLVPSLLEILITHEETFKRLKSLRQVLCGADILEKNILEIWHKNSTSSLTNLYGLTETCIDSTHFDCKSSLEFSDVPIGRPLKNIETYLLSYNHSLLPMEIPGELYIGGLGLARGYYKKYDLTAERFIPHPFKKGERLFRTLDMAIWKSDNQLHYLTRKDNQIKLHGFRVEIGEIEKALSLYPGVEKALVKVIGTETNRTLCAYFVSQFPLKTDLVKAFLMEKIPYYSVPNHYVHLTSFPLNSHGKIDIKALPIPNENKEKEDYIPAQNMIQKQLESLWKECLKLKTHSISIDTNFFDLGGNSITLMHMHAQLSKTYKKKIAIEQLFQYPTIRTLANFLDQSEDNILDINDLQQRAKKQKQRYLTRKS